MLQFTNYVCCSDLNCEINLAELARKSHNVVYNPRRFNGLIWRHSKLQGTCLVFRTGKIVCNGIRERRKIKETVRKYARLISKAGFAVCLQRIKLVTSSACYKLQGAVDYIKLLKNLEGTLEPEIFHALRIHRQGVHFTVFQTGRVVITGIKTKEDLENIVRPFLLELEIYL